MPPIYTRMIWMETAFLWWLLGCKNNPAAWDSFLRVLWGDPACESYQHKGRKLELERFLVALFENEIRAA